MTQTEQLQTQTHELDVLSEQNIGVITDSYVNEAVRLGQFASPEDALAAVSDSRKELEQNHSLKINMTAESLGRFMDVGKHETYWHAQEPQSVVAALGAVSLHNGKNMHNSYADYRRAAEAGLSAFAPVPDAEYIRPRYAAVAGNRPKDTFMGPAWVYGNWWVELSPELEDRSVYHFSDSHANVRIKQGEHEFDTKSVLNKHDALTAKAIMDLSAAYNASQGYQYSGRGGMAINVDPAKLMNIAGHGAGGYVEGVVYDEIETDKVVGVGGFITNDAEISAAGQLIKEHPEVFDGIVSLRLSNSVVSALVRDWLERKLGSDVVSEVGERVDSELPVNALKDLGIDITDEYEDLARSLHRASVVLSKQLKGKVRYIRPPKDMSTSEGAGKWDRYIKTLRGEMRSATPAQASTLQQFIEVQQACLFFKSSPLEVD